MNTNEAIKIPACAMNADDALTSPARDADCRPLALQVKPNGGSPIAPVDPAPYGGGHAPHAPLPNNANPFGGAPLGRPH